MNILGLSAFYHDSAAALICDGKIVAAAQEERFTRKKHDPGFPRNALSYCLQQAQLQASDIDYVVFYDKPFLKFDRLLETYLSFAPKGFKSFIKALPSWIKEKLFQKKHILEALQELAPKIRWEEKLLFTEHHQSHAASAFYPSPFEQAAVLTMDGVGEWCTSSVAVGNGNQLDFIREIHFPSSLGLLYSAFTYYLGFKVNSGEYKVMGLAPYGEAKYTKQIYDHLIDVKDDGSFRLNQDYFNYCTGLTMTSKKFNALFGRAPRKSESDLEQFHMDMAASVQAVTEDIVMKIAKNIAEETGQKNLCLAGGVALNCVANGKLLRAGIFDNIWIQPAAGDAGGALGAALAAHYTFLDKPRSSNSKDSMQGSYLGPSFSNEDIANRLSKLGAKFVSLSDSELIEKTATALADGLAVGWFQGRMEYGPRALGGRSILADPRNPKMQKNLNLKVKFRESFRPFAPSVLRNKVASCFELDADSPYMLLVAPLAETLRRNLSEQENNLFGIEKLNTLRSELPAITHVDYSARVQTVDGEFNPEYHSLISKFYEKTDCPVLVNTSFNIRGEPIVCSPEDAFKCFMGTDLDVLAIGNCFLLKTEQDTSLTEDYRSKFDLD